ncbi:MAG: acyl-CoA dehydrogenase family protein, partial [Actinomycetota bacterium]
MDFALSEQQQALRKSAREFLEAEAPITLARAKLEHETGFEPGLWTQMAEQGWMGVAVPEAEGGLGLGMVELVLLLEEMGRVVAPSPFYSTVALAAPVVAALSTDPEGRRSFFGAVAAGELRLTLALAEDSGSFDETGIAATAERAGDGWVLRGRKSFVPDAHLADEIVVVARTPGGIGAFLVPAADCAIEPKQSLDRTRRLSAVTLGGVRVGAARLLGEEGTAWPSIRRALDRAAVGLAAEAVGVADAAMNATLA